MKSKQQSLDCKAFEILVREHHRRLMAYAMSLCKTPSFAEDIVQESFLIAFRKLDSFDTSRNFAAWMRGIIRLEYIDHCKKVKELPLPNYELDALEHTHCHWDNLEDDKNAIFKALNRCIEKLPEMLQKTLNFFYMKELSGLQVAEALNCNTTTVRKRLQRSRKQLKECINNQLVNQGKGTSHE